MRPLTCEIRLDYLRDNYQYLKALHGNKLLAVMKANAYGHGAVQCARAVLRWRFWKRRWSCARRELPSRLWCWKGFFRLPIMRRWRNTACGRWCIVRRSWRGCWRLIGASRQRCG